LRLVVAVFEAIFFTRRPINTSHSADIVKVITFIVN
jgi:hypothetical protein